jgi:hypothetical protein
MQARSVIPKSDATTQLSECLPTELVGKRMWNFQHNCRADYRNGLCVGCVGDYGWLDFTYVERRRSDEADIRKHVGQLGKESSIQTGALGILENATASIGHSMIITRKWMVLLCREYASSVFKLLTPKCKASDKFRKDRLSLSSWTPYF